MIDIETKGNQENQQRTNKIKGTALQKLVLPTIENKREDLSLKKILNLVSKRRNEYYIVKKEFKINEHIFKVKNEFVHIDELGALSSSVLLSVPEDEKGWKTCSHCKNFIKAEKQRTRKCRKCNIGYFNFVSNKTYVKKSIGLPPFIIRELVDSEYIKPVTLSKRADFFCFVDNTFYIFECKNKEVTGLCYSDVWRTLFYPIVLQKCGYDVKEVIIVYNGMLQTSLDYWLNAAYIKKYNLDIKFKKIRNYLIEHNCLVSGVRVTKPDGKYKYEVVEGDVNPMFIDLDFQ